MFEWIRKPRGAKPLDTPADGGAWGIRIDPQTYGTIYAVGDVHGRLDLLTAAEAKIEADLTGDVRPLVVYLGDYIDRGPQSGGVLERLRVGEAAHFTRLCLRGNHDDVFLRFLADPVGEEGWLDFGGKETLVSYGLNPQRLQDDHGDVERMRDRLRKHVPGAHVEFLQTLPHFASWNDYLFVHAGIQPGVPLARQEASDMLWIREPFLSTGPDLPLTVVHGHTPQSDVSYGPGRIGIDTGAYATGRLTVLKVTAEGAAPL